MIRFSLKIALAATLSALTLGAVAAPRAFAAFGFETTDLTVTDSGGLPQLGAGSHPFAMTTTLEMNTVTTPDGDLPEGAVRDIVTRLPEGLVGNPTAAPPCPNEDFTQVEKETFRTACDDASAVGIAGVEANFGPLPPGEGHLFYVAVYNLEPLPGEAARLGLIVLNEPVTIDVGVSEEKPYEVIAKITKVPQPVQFFGAELEIWGNPVASVHDTLRGHCIKSNDFSGIPVSEGSCPAVGVDEEPFLTLPRACEGPLSTNFSADTWEAPGSFVSKNSDSTLTFEDCGTLGFEPTIDAKPTAAAAETPTGLNFELNIEDPGLTSPTLAADSDIEKAVVTLPRGVITNPAVASGLGACTLIQYESETVTSTPGTGCPGSSKVGTVEVETDLLKGEVLNGSIYVAKQGDNPFHNLLSIYMLIKSPKLGILIQAAGKVEPNPTTGQLTTTFDELPQLPFSHFRLHFREGPRAPLITPPTCGTYNITADLYPYADPTEPRPETVPFEVNSGANGAGCITSSGQLPNAPGFSAGTVNSKASAYSPFVFRISREDGSQRLQSISTTLPGGLVGKLAGIPYCSDAQIAAAQARGGEGQGAVELTSPACPLASEVGTVTVGAGAGGQPYHVQGHGYLAGPYKGAPLSLVIVTPAIAGPFDLGTVAVRTALYVNPETAQISAVSDPIPTILHGLPLVVRSVALEMNRPNFTLNPTSCEPKAILGSATSTLGQVASLSQYFQASSCGSLGFKPKLALRLKGGTKRDKNPALTATVTYPKRGAYANIARAQVTLPHSAFLDQSHIRTICTRVQFAADQCPKGSIYGHARATTPLLDQPIKGPVYLRSSNHELPDLVAKLRGQVEVVLVGRIDTGKSGGIRNTFEAVPDAPVSKFTLEMAGGKKGLLVNSENICKKPQSGSARFVAQNGKRLTLRPLIENSCQSQGKTEESPSPELNPGARWLLRMAGQAIPR